MKRINKDMIIADVLKVDVELAPFFFAIGMHCLGCPSASGETIEEACLVHDTNCEELVEKMNNFLEIKENKMN
jgi:hybrid cluster-associated redox disulfide protein